MSEEALHNPHDQLFKAAFSRRETAVGFFQSYLPEDIRSRLDWETLRLQPGVYTDEALRGSESDLLYSVQIDNRPVLLYCLFEHQSSPDAWMPLRLLRYILGIWEQYRKQNPADRILPPVLPMVLYQGSTQWNTDLSLSGLIDIPDGLALYQPDFRHLLVDLTHIDADALQGTLLVKAVLLALKAGCQGPRHEATRIFSMFAELMQQHDNMAIVRTLLRYICAVDSDADIADYIHEVAALKEPQLREELMTIAEQLRKEGREQGMQQGMQQEATKTLLKILSKRFGPIPDDTQRLIHTAETSQIEAWIDAALDSENLRQVFPA